MFNTFCIVGIFLSGIGIGVFLTLIGVIVKNEMNDRKAFVLARGKNV